MRGLARLARLVERLPELEPKLFVDHPQEIERGCSRRRLKVRARLPSKLDDDQIVG